MKKPRKKYPRLLSSGNPQLVEKIAKRLAAAAVSEVCERTFDEVLAELEARGFEDPGCREAWITFADIVVCGVRDVMGERFPEVNSFLIEFALEDNAVGCENLEAREVAYGING